MPPEVNESVSNGGKFSEASGFELFEIEGTAELVRPELVRIEQIVELSGLEISVQEEVAEISSELVGPEGVCKQVLRKIAGVEEIMEFAVGEVPGTIKPGIIEARSVESGSSIKRGDAIEDKVSMCIKGERPFKARIWGPSRELATVWVEVACEEFTGRRLIEELAGGRFRIEFATRRRLKSTVRAVCKPTIYKPIFGRRLIKSTVRAFNILAVRRRGISTVARVSTAAGISTATWISAAFLSKRQI